MTHAPCFKGWGSLVMPWPCAHRPSCDRAATKPLAMLPIFHASARQPAAAARRRASRKCAKHHAPAVDTTARLRAATKPRMHRGSSASVHLHVCISTCPCVNQSVVHVRPSVVSCVSSVERPPDSLARESAEADVQQTALYAHARGYLPPPPSRHTLRLREGGGLGSPPQQNPVKHQTP